MRRRRHPVDPADREYYREVHGFDPVTLREPLNRRGTHYRYEKGFPLASDPAMHAAGVTIWARVDVLGEKIRNRIVFKRGRREAAVTCVHTAILSLESGEARHLTDEDIVELAHSTEHRNVNIVPEEHFASLKSYVAGVAELGLANLMGTVYYSQEFARRLPFGFNALMQRQVVVALRAVSPRAAQALFTNLIFDLAENVPVAWFDEQLRVFDGLRGRSWHLKKLFERYGFFGYLFETFFPHPERFWTLVELVPSWRLKKLAARYRHADPEIHERLARDEDWGVASWARENLSRSARAALEPPGNPSPGRQPARVPSDRAVREEVKLDAAPETGREPWIFNGRRLPGPEARVLSRLELRLKRGLPPGIPMKPHAWGFEAGDGRVTALVINGGKLKRLPEGFRHLEALTRLQLRWTRLRRFPPALLALSRLEVLDLTRNKIRHLPEDIGQLQNLRTLVVARNRFKELPTGIGALDSLSRFDAARNRLQELPLTIGTLTRLTRLNLGGNRLQNLPATMASLSTLEVLDLSYNGLARLPGVIKHLGKLRELHAAGNRIRVVPAFLSRLKRLRFLDLTENYLTRVDALARCKGLTRLILRKNRIDALPADLGHWQKLVHLELQENRLTTLPDALRDLAALRRVSVNYNALESLPPGLLAASGLQEVYLSHNQIARLPSRFPDWSRLRTLDLSHNALRKCPPAMGDLATLEKLFLNVNHLHAIPRRVGDLRQLRILDVARNHLHALPAEVLALPRLSRCIVSPGNSLETDSEGQEQIRVLEERGIRTRKGMA